MLKPRHADIIQGLRDAPARISPKYFYDERGSELFDAITRVPEYYPTRTEHGILREHGADIARAVGPGSTLIEPGAGSCQKAAVLCELLAPRCFVGVDISVDYLAAAVERVGARFPGMAAFAVGGDITRGIHLPAQVPTEKCLVFYPGSSIGNFDPQQALALLRQMRALAGDGGGLLIGIDLPKDVAVLEAAYDDSQGVTAEFNLNALAHLNRLIGSDFALDDWQHRAFFNAEDSRIEMHLEARSPVRVRWAGGERAFAAGERIHTENSYKYPLEVFCDLLAQAGFSRSRVWSDARGWFAVVHAQP
ncbi:MAG: L-histidine N(alpha)-methyltransferase [Giesbergeria sp.]